MPKKQRRKSVTLLEMIVVIILVGVLAALALPNFGPFKEKTLEREAKSNLSLIRAAEKIYRMENAFYYPSTTASPISTTGTINNDLKLAIPGANPYWQYKIESTGPGNFSAKARRVSTPANVWCITDAVDDPYSGGCSW
ncbi:MAG: type II secretion system protein [Candidatus Omnitrophica bacterium]|nr:type II secretion system protein [Candidatus Omnitrophota bacterium]